MRAAPIKVIACLAALAVRTAEIPAFAQDANLTATPEQAATLTIAPPRSPADVFLDVSVKAYRPPRQGAADAVVTAAPAGGKPVEIGRISIFPSVAFDATDTKEQLAYRFNAATLLRQLKPSDNAIVVRVTLIPMNEKFPLQGAALTLGKAEFSPRP